MLLSTAPATIPAATALPERGGNLAPPLLVQYWDVALRWKWLIAAIVIAATIAGLIITLLMTPQYTAATRIEISREQKKVTNVEGLESAEASRDLEFYQTQYSLLAARSLAERVARVLKLGSSDTFFKAHGVNVEGMAGNGRVLTADQRTQRERTAVSLLLKNVSISPIRGSALVDIKYTSASPADSAAIANTWAEQFIELSMDRRYASTAEARKFLEVRLADLRARVESSERDVVNYAMEKGIVALGKTKSADGQTQIERTLVSNNLEALNEALAKATADRIAAESRANARATRADATSEALGNLAIGQLRQRRAEVAGEYSRMMVQFEPSYPAARAVAEQLRTLDASIAAEERRVRSSVSGDYREALTREDTLRNQVETLKARMNQQQRDNIQYNIYQREADTNRQLYDGLLQRYKEIGVAGVGTNNIAVVDTAKIPSSPSAPISC